MTNTPSNSPKPQSVEYACMKIGISRPTLYDLMSRGKLKTYKIGRARRISDEAIHACVALLEAETAQGAASPQ
jgi:excisionase family DNA binding protein